MAGYAHPPQFEESADHWPAYLVRLEAIFEGNDITEEKKKRALLVAGLSTHTEAVVSGRCAPSKVNALSCQAALDILQQHFSPSQNEIAQSYKFFSHSRMPVVQLLQLSNYSYNVKFKDGKANTPADALSRLPRAMSSREVSGDEYVDEAPMTVSKFF
ncbi:hypothetical protein MTO96_027050 [Rhipicephalus appendiculatus]